MSEIRPVSPVDEYYTGQPAQFPIVEQGRESALTVTPHTPEEGDVLDRAAAAEWRVFDAPNSTQQFEGLVFNKDANGSTLLVPTTAGEYNPGHMYEGALWAAQNPDQRLVLLPTFNLTKKELVYYARTGKLTDEQGRPLPSMQHLAQSLAAADIEATGIYGRSAGTKEASVLPQVIPSVSGIVLGAPPQLTKQSAASLTRGALAENSQQRLIYAGHTAEDGFQVSEAWKEAVAQARQGRPERQKPTGAIAATVGNIAVRGAHALGLSKGSEAFMADLRGLRETNVDLMVYTDDALYGQGLGTGLEQVAAALDSTNANPPMRIASIPGGHRVPERYPRVTNDMVDELFSTQQG